MFVTTDGTKAELSAPRPGSHSRISVGRSAGLCRRNGTAVGGWRMRGNKENHSLNTAQCIPVVLSWGQTCRIPVNASLALLRMARFTGMFDGTRYSPASGLHGQKMLKLFNIPCNLSILSCFIYEYLLWSSSIISIVTKEDDFIIFLLLCPGCHRSLIS